MPDAPAILTGATPTTPPITATSTPAAAQPPVRSEAPPKPVTPGSKAWAEMSPDQRAAQTRAQSDAGRTSADLHTRDSNNRLLINGKYADGSSPQPDPNSPPVDSAAPTADGEKFKVGEFEVSESEVRDMLADKAARDLAKAQIPADPKGYKLELPADVKLPGDAKVAFDNPDNSAAAQAVTEWAHKNGLSQGQFSELLSIQAHREAQADLKFREAQHAELLKLGTTGPQRADALTKWIVSIMGTKDAHPIVSTMVSEAHVRFYETLFNKVVNGGAGSFRQTGREVESKGVDEATYNSWSYGEKKAYAERMSTQGGAGGRR